MTKACSVRAYKYALGFVSVLVVLLTAVALAAGPVASASQPYDVANFTYDESLDLAPMPTSDLAGTHASAADPAGSILRPSSPTGQVYEHFASFVAPTSAPSYNDLRRAGQTDAHHIIQHAAVRDVPGHSRGQAPAIQLDGPSTQVGSPHFNATQVQRQAGGRTYGAERQTAACSLAAAGCSPSQIADALALTDSYFTDGLGLTLDSPLRISGNRPR